MTFKLLQVAKATTQTIRKIARQADRQREWKSKSWHDIMLSRIVKHYFIIEILEESNHDGSTIITLADNNNRINLVKPVIEV